MSEIVTTGQAATLLNRQVHQVRRVADEIWPDMLRAGQNRLIRKANYPNWLTRSPVDIDRRRWHDEHTARPDSQRRRQRDPHTF